MRAQLLLACLALAACSSLELATLHKLHRLDPLTADPAAFAARLSLPEGLAIPPGGAVLTLSARRQDTGQTLARRVNLVRAGDVWKLAEPDAARLRTLQMRIRDWKADAQDASSGSLSLSLTGCVTGAGPDPAAPVSADLSLDGGASFAPLVRGVKAGEIAALAGPSADSTWHRCPD